MTRLRLAGIISESFVDGPGIRFVVFAQGCSHNCFACHNPDTHDHDGGKFYEVDQIYMQIMNQKNITGVTFSGGEPFDQALEFAELAEMLKKQGINIVTYTGYTFEYILGNTIEKKGWMELLKQTDILIEGPYIHELRDISLAFRGSSNQRVIDVKKTLALGQLVEMQFTSEVKLS